MPFKQLKLNPALVKAIKELGFVRPTLIQAEAIPPALEGRDVIACAQTGSGKTAAFLLPIINRLIDRPRRTTRALVLAPTRELAAQTLEDFNALSVHTPVSGAAVYGGVGMGPQEHAFRSGVDLIIATPGRLMDHMRSAYARVNHIEHLVLDEADRMLDMGFLPEIRRIIAKLPARRQTLFFSATMPPPIAALAGEMLRDPVSIQMQQQAAPTSGITQAPDDYIRRVGRTGRAEATGEAFTFVSPEEEDDLRAIERAIAKRLPRVTVPDFDYTARPKQTLEIPLAQRIAEIRARKREDRARGELNAARRAAAARRPGGPPRESRWSGHPARGGRTADRGHAPGAGALGNRRRGGGRRGRPGPGRSRLPQS